ncbi:Cysteine-rich receptor-like protein kinase 10 [Bienertia sinuspersici]
MGLSNTNIHSSLFLGIILIFSIPKLVFTQFTAFTYKSCSDGFTYSPNSSYQSNLKTALNSLSTDTRTTNGFYNFTVGQQPDQVSSFALCRGDVPVNTCRACIQRAAELIIGSDGCPNQKQAFGYSGYCSIYFSNGSIYGKLQDDLSPWFITDSNTITNSKGFNQSLYSLMNSLQNEAASGNTTLKYAAGKAGFSGGQDLYGLVQCSPDLSKQNCVQCIQKLISLKPKSKISGVTMVEPNCFVRYNLDPFYGNVPNLLLSSPPLALPSNQTHNSSSATSTEDEIEALDTLQFSLGTVKNATRNFSDDHKLGKGGFGTVYKGILSGGQEIAVKRCLRNLGHGDAEFKNEILILAKLRHKNLVKLLGFCLHGNEMILIYEFVANRSLDYFIFGGLKIIHRDLKAGNVLLDGDFNPKIADFERQVSVKSDVYSFGVLVLEIVSGKAITSFSSDEDQESLTSFAWKNWTAGTAWNLVDPAIIQTGSSTEILRCFHIGLLCVQDNPIDRPTMSSIDLMLNSYSITLEAPMYPAFFTDSNYLPRTLSQWTATGTTASKSSNKSAADSINGVSITELHPR